MKKLFLLGLAFLFMGGASSVKAQSVTVVDDLSKADGEAYVYNKADGKTYALNNLGAYELYGVYVKTNTLNIADPAATPKVIDYIATTDDNKAYINTDYVHKANTRVVADVVITQAEGTADKWRAVFGSRKGGGGGATNGLVYFYHNGTSSRGMYKRNVAEYAGADQDPKTESVPINERITIDANGHVLSITKYGESKVFSTIKTPDSEELSEGINPLFIFDLSSGDGAADGSRARMKLYGFQIYEGETLVRNYEPIVNSEGKGGLHETETNTYLYSADDKVDFLLSPDAEEKLTPGIPVYEGKMVIYEKDGKVYKYDGTEFVLSGDGNRTLGGEIANSDYKNMKNWYCPDGPDGHWLDVFGRGDKIDWNEGTQTNTFDPYVGTGGWEPLRYVFNNLEANADYNVSFNYSTGGWKTWENGGAGGGEVDSPVNLPFKIIDREGIEQNNGRFGTDAGWINGAKLTPDKQNETPVSVDFNTPTGIATFIIQFGVVDDNAHEPNYWFKFSNLSVKKYNYPEAYPALNPYKGLLEDLIAEVEAATLNTTTVLSNTLSTDLTAAKGVVAGDDLAAQKEKLDALQAAYDAAKAVDVTILSATVDLAKDEGVNVDAAETFLAEGTTADALNSTLEALRMARKQAHFETDNATYTGHEPFEGKFYLYNVGRKNYLSSGSNWGTHLALGYPGLELTATAEGNGYKFQFQELNNGAREQMMTADYADGNTTDIHYVVYTFEPIDGKPGVYALKNGDNYLSFDPEATPDGTKYYNSVTSFIPSKESEDAQWIIVTKEDRLAQLNNATSENPVDATVLIKDASFNKYADLDNPWNDLNQEWWYGERIHGDKNTQTQKTDGYDLSQTITVPRAGKYKLKAQSYYRDGSIETYITSVKNGDALTAAPNLYAQIDGVDVATQAIKYLHEDADKAPGEGTNHR